MTIPPPRALCDDNATAACLGTNVTLIQRTITSDGTLLKPDKPLTSIDALLSAGAGTKVSALCPGHCRLQLLQQRIAQKENEEKQTAEKATR